MMPLKYEQNKYLTDNVKKVLNQNRIVSIVDLLQQDVEKLSALTKLSIQQVMGLKKDLLTKYGSPLINGCDLFLKINKKTHLKTSLHSLDEILNGGLPVCYITEVCGLADSGKTQLCFQIAINCAKTNNSVLYIDTKGDFSSIRIQKILELHGISCKDMALAMYHIRFVHIWTLEELVDLFANLKRNNHNPEQLSLVIIDSLPSLMLQFLGDDNKMGLTLLNNLVNYARFLAKEFELAILFVNILTRWVDIDAIDDEEEQLTRDPVYIEKKNRCLGKYWSQIPAVILCLEKNSNSNSEKSIQINVTLARLFGPTNKLCIIKLSSPGMK